MQVKKATYPNAILQNSITSSACNKPFQHERKKIWEGIELTIKANVLVPQFYSIFHIFRLFFELNFTFSPFFIIITGRNNHLKNCLKL